MSVFEEGLFIFLSSQGMVCADRIYPIRLPQGVTLPAITYSLVSDPHDYSQDGQSSLNNPRYQINCWGETYANAKNLANDMISQMGGYQGNMGNASVQATFVEDDRDNVDPVTGRCWVSVDVIIWHKK